ncbi:unnamed protein product [Danaus chrysippus]|uniref:40S ribosomal protein S27 n=1 Tax=Danaus chrysippus TaxID=151541 RepID=A0A8J2QQ41_9NEOP|nr:unnamed protein product [Danaus chrysippus]
MYKIQRCETCFEVKASIFRTSLKHGTGVPNLNLAIDLLHPSPASERRKHKLKRLVPHPNSYFMDVKCPGCYKITTVFSHAQRVVVCAGCSTILCQPTGGRARLTEGNYYFKLYIS